jgi:hypothetical protein
MEEANSYLRSLHKQLESLNVQNQAELLAEIQHHIEEGLQDEQNGASPEERLEKTMKEMGSSDELANGFYQTHGRNTWVDVLWAVGPLLGIMLAGIWLVEPLFSLARFLPFITLYSLLYLVVCSAMVWLSFRRKRAMLELWWLSWSLVFLVDAFYGQLQWGKWIRSGDLPGGLLIPQSWGLLLFWAAALLLIGSIAASRLWRYRQNGALIAFFTVPWIFTLLSKGMQIVETWFNPAYNQMPYNDYLLYALVSATDWWKALKVVAYLSLAAAVMLVPKRQARWLLIAGFSAVYIAGTALVWRLSVPTVTLFSLLAAAPMLWGAWVDFKNTKRLGAN